MSVRRRRAVARFIRAEFLELGGVFLVVFAMVIAATLASALAWSGVGLIAFVPLVGLAVFPLQIAALLVARPRLRVHRADGDGRVRHAVSATRGAGRGAGGDEDVAGATGFGGMTGFGSGATAETVGSTERMSVLTIVP